jgi:hypothetical protein
VTSDLIKGHPSFKVRQIPVKVVDHHGKEYQSVY